VVNDMRWPLYSWECPSTHCTWVWVVLRASLGRYGKSHPHHYSIPRTSSPQWVTIYQLHYPIYQLTQRNILEDLFLQ